jgi:hypothetical protein
VIVQFRERLIATLRAIKPLLEVPGVLVIGSEVPNLLENRAAATLVISEDVDIGVPLSSHAEVKRRLPDIKGLTASPEEPSVWVPKDDRLIEVNFVGMSPDIRGAGESYVLEDPELPLLVLGNLSVLRPGQPIEVEGLTVPVPRPAGLLLEKLISERSGIKGDRDLLVVLGLLLVTSEAELNELCEAYEQLPAELQYTVRTNLTVLSLLEPIPGMPDPTAHRQVVAHLLQRLEAQEDE